MNFFNQIAPRLVRSNSRSDDRPQEARATVKPQYDLQENAEAWGLTVQLPGVTREGLEISSEEGQLVIRGERSWKRPDGWTAVHRETPEAGYELVLEHDNVVDTDKIHAELKNGVLRVSLPKAEAIKPRKISVG